MMCNCVKKTLKKRNSPKLERGRNVQARCKNLRHRSSFNMLKKLSTIEIVYEFKNFKKKMDLCIVLFI